MNECASSKQNKCNIDKVYATGARKQQYNCI